TPVSPALVLTTSESTSANDDHGRDYTWTKESRLEQVNVECCSQLSLATMTRIKDLALERQSALERQGRKKGRIWIENEHDMMMTRLAMERGPELPASRLGTNITSCSSSDSSISTDLPAQQEQIEQQESPTQQAPPPPPQVSNIVVPQEEEEEEGEEEEGEEEEGEEEEEEEDDDYDDDFMMMMTAAATEVVA
ncbi:hypothetical protein BGZ65_009542, partial [Modicella reniformis]